MPAPIQAYFSPDSISAGVNPILPVAQTKLLESSTISHLLIHCQQMLWLASAFIQNPPILTLLPLLPCPAQGHIFLYYHKCFFHFSSVAQSCTTLCNPMDCSTPGFLVLHQLPELAQTRAHRVGDVIQPSHSLSSPSPPAFSLPQHQGLFQGVSSLHHVAKILELQPLY